MTRLLKRKNIFLYENGKTRKYFLDFFLPDFNLIVEIKSTYTLERDKNRELKRLSVIAAGYSFLWVIDKKYDVLIELLNNDFSSREPNR